MMRKRLKVLKEEWVEIPIIGNQDMCAKSSQSSMESCARGSEKTICQPRAKTGPASY